MFKTVSKCTLKSVGNLSFVRWINKVQFVKCSRMYEETFSNFQMENFVFPTECRFPLTDEVDDSEMKFHSDFLNHFSHLWRLCFGMPLLYFTLLNQVHFESVKAFQCEYSQRNCQQTLEYLVSVCNAI